MLGGRGNCSFRLHGAGNTWFPRRGASSLSSRPRTVFSRRLPEGPLDGTAQERPLARMGVHCKAYAAFAAVALVLSAGAADVYPVTRLAPAGTRIADLPGAEVLNPPGLVEGVAITITAATVQVSSPG